MKSIIYTYSIPVVLFFLLLGCGKPSSDKLTTLNKLKAQQAELAGEISKLEKEIAKDNPKASSAKSKEIAVKELTLQPFDYYVQTQGTVEAVDNILVSAKTMGVITQVFAKEGDEVTKGQVLAQIDNTITVRSIEELKSGLELATTVYDRQKNLWEQKIGTEVQFLQAKNNKEGLEKRMAILNEQLDMSRIKSPINGSIDQVGIKIGQNAAPGVPAFRVISSNRLKLTANISEAYATSIRKGNKAIISYSNTAKSIDAKVTFVGKAIDQMSRTFPVEIGLSPNAALRPNMTAVLKVIFYSTPSAIVVPINLIQEINGQKIVYTAEMEADKLVARRKVIEVAGVYGNSAHVKGLNNGDKVITVGYQGLNDGELIKI
jgi:membrane fusion protein, multidrug efflux system